MQATPAAAAAAQHDSKCDDFAAPAETRGGSDQKSWVANFFLVRSIGSAATDYSGSIFPRNGLFICLSGDLNARPCYFV